MSRVAKAPVTVPSGVTVTLNDQQVEVKGSKGELSLRLHDLVELKQEDGQLSVSPVTNTKEAWMHAGTVRSLLSNLIVGVSNGFEKKLELKGVGYKAQINGNVVHLNLGFSHPIDYVLPEGVSAVTPTPTEIVLQSCDKQKVGQAAAEIRSFRPPEPYKGKGVKYAGEQIIRKEAKKK